MGLCYASWIVLCLELAIFPVCVPVFMADLVVEVMEKPQNYPFPLHGGLRPWFWKALASKSQPSPVDVVMYVKWLLRSQRTPGEISSSGECISGFLLLNNGFLLAYAFSF